MPQVSSSTTVLATVTPVANFPIIWRCILASNVTRSASFGTGRCRCDGSTGRRGESRHGRLVAPAEPAARSRFVASGTASRAAGGVWLTIWPMTSSSASRALECFGSPPSIEVVAASPSRHDDRTRRDRRLGAWTISIAAGGDGRLKQEESPWATAHSRPAHPRPCPRSATLLTHPGRAHVPSLYLRRIPVSGMLRSDAAPAGRSPQRRISNSLSAISGPCWPKTATVAIRQRPRNCRPACVWISADGWRTRR